MSAILSGTLAVLMEELIFRGFIQNELERIYWLRNMWIFAGILFGLWHIPTD